MNSKKYEEEILVVDTKTLLDKNYFNGFITANINNYDKLILENFKFVKRRFAETNPELKQPISYCVLINPVLKKIYYFQRGTGKAYTEQRLASKFSLGIGGHIEKQDSQNPLLNSAKREIGEEVIINGDLSEPKILGYINDDSSEVSKVHFGVVYIFETNATNVKPKDEEMFHGELISFEKLETLLNNKNIDFENWSLLLTPFLLKEFKQ